ncbi:MAG: transposase [Mesorhizobium sp.]|nr:MAG: transposase [Mesorhizobium sp.]
MTAATVRCGGMRRTGMSNAAAPRPRPTFRLVLHLARPTSSTGVTEIVLLDGVTVTVKVAHMRLCHSRMFFVRAYPRETQEMVFDAHDRAFAFFRGACTRGIYDNMKTAVDASSAGIAATTAALRRCAGITLSSRRPAHRRPAGRRGNSRTRSGWCASASSHRGCASRRWRISTAGWPTNALPNAKARRHPEQGERTIWDVLEEERASFIPYAGRFDGYHCIPASVSKTCTVRFDNNKYSVLSSAVGRPV